MGGVGQHRHTRVNECPDARQRPGHFCRQDREVAGAVVPDHGRADPGDRRRELGPDQEVRSPDPNPPTHGSSPRLGVFSPRGRPTPA